MGSHGSRQPGREREGWKVGVVGVREENGFTSMCVLSYVCVSVWHGEVAI